MGWTLVVAARFGLNYNPLSQDQYCTGMGRRKEERSSKARETTMTSNGVTIDERFLFDLQGFLLLKGVLSQEECERYLTALTALEEREYDDGWIAARGLETGRLTKELKRANQVRLNGIVRLDPAFDGLIDHAQILPYLKEFVGDPQLINSWSITKFKGAVHSGWHRGVPTSDYSYHDGEARSRMFNTVFFLTDNGPEDGCVVALPGSHKSSFDLRYQDYEGLELPGAAPLTGSAGDVLLFSECVMHNGLLKTTEGVRSNLYFNYVHAHYNVMMREPNNCHHFYFWLVSRIRG